VKENFDASLFETQCASDFTVLGALNVGEPHHRPLLWPQPREYTSEINSKWDVLWRCGPACFVGRFDWALEALPTPVIRHQVAGDPKEECAQLVVIISFGGCL
jgi:hypothetical protein